jgi:hypothetical protein
MLESLYHFNQYSGESALDWNGLRSAKFGKTRLSIPSKDAIDRGNFIELFRFQPS